MSKPFVKQGARFNYALRRVRLSSLAQDIRRACIRDNYSPFTHVACHEQALCVTKGASNGGGGNRSKFTHDWREFKRI